MLKVAWANEMMTTDVYQRTIIEKGVPKDSTKAGRALTPTELKLLMGTCAEMSPPEGPKAAAILATMYAAGLRRIEITRLQLSDVACATGALAVLGKRNKKRVAYVAPGWIKYLRAWIDVRGDAPGPLFCHEADQRGYSANGIAAIVNAVRDQAGIAAFTPHDLRRSFGTHLLAAGKDLSLVRDLMGHEDVRTTMVYDRRGEEEKRAAVGVLSEEQMEVMARTLASAHTGPKEKYTLREIFHFQEGFGEFDASALETFAQAIASKHIAVTRVDLPPLAQVRDTELVQFSGRTREHKVLCLEAARYIATRKWTWTVAEPRLKYSGGVADVADLGGRLFIECGYTQTGKVLRGVRGGKEVMVIPYLYTTPTVGFLFAPGAVPFPPPPKKDPFAVSSAQAVFGKEKGPAEAGPFKP